MSDNALSLASPADLIGLIAARMARLDFEPSPWIGPLFGMDDGGQIAIYASGCYSIDLAETVWSTPDQGYTLRAARGAQTVTTTAQIRWLRPWPLDAGHDGYREALTHEQRVISSLLRPDPPAVARFRVARARRDVLLRGWLLVEVELLIDHPYSISE